MPSPDQKHYIFTGTLKQIQNQQQLMIQKNALHKWLQRTIQTLNIHTLRVKQKNLLLYLLCLIVLSTVLM